MRFPRFPVAVCAALAMLVVSVAPVHAYIPEQTPERAATAAADRMLREPAARAPRAGVVVLRGGEMLVGIGEREAMTPASLIKLATTTAAIVRFGPDHRFVTRVAGSSGGPHVQDLWLVGGGDPTLSTERYRRRRFLPKPSDRIKRPAFPGGSPTIEELAAAVRAAGVRSVGRVIADETLFDGRRTQTGWLRRYLAVDPDIGLLSALTVNEGRADLEGDRNVSSPPRAAALALRAALRAQGIAVGGVGAGAAPRGAAELASVSSPPLREIVDFINRYSVNYPSELVLKNLGAAFGGEGSTRAGARVVRDTLRELGVPVRGLRMTDGSGLSVLDRVAPITIARLLQRIVTGRGEGWRALRSSLPAAGGAGTLLNRMTRPPTGGNLRGKTGQISMVRGMAGWVRARDGVPVVYVALFNRAPSPFALTDPLDLFGTLLARLPSAA